MKYGKHLNADQKQTLLSTIATHVASKHLMKKYENENENLLY